MSNRKDTRRNEDDGSAVRARMDNTNSRIQAIDERQAASILCRSVQTLRNERFLGKGCPYVKLGRSVRYLIRDIEGYLQRNRIDPDRA